VCPQSDFFKAACKNNFQEGATGVVKLDTSDDPSSDDPEAVKQMLHFFYHLNYKVTVLGEPSAASVLGKRQRTSDSSSPFTPTTSVGLVDDGNMLAHVKVFAAAVKYNVSTSEQIPPLRLRG
jgi:hypothetical protein